MSSAASETASADPRRAPIPWSVWLVLAFAVFIRAGAFNLRHDTLVSDPDGYRRLARNLLGEGVFGNDEKPTAYRPPLYPLLLVPCLAVEDQHLTFFAIRLLHVVLGVGTVGAVLWLGARWKLGRWSLLAALLVACDPILINQSLVVMTETLATCLAALSLVALTRFDERPSVARAAIVGCCLGLAALCRPTFLPWAGLVVVAEAWRLPAWSGKAKYGGAMLAALALTLAPWAVRNQLQLSRPIVTTTHGGYTLLLGNNESYYKFLKTSKRGEVWQSKALEEFDEEGGEGVLNILALNSELEADRSLYDWALGTIRQQPRTFLYASLVRLTRLWGLLPRQVEGAGRSNALRYATAAWYLAEFILAAAGLAVLRGQLLRSPWLWGALLALTFMAVHAVYWTDMRMRAPLVPFAALLAACGAAAIAGRFLRRKA
ncbi:MAG TPA: glycosyltransferase family 39 protein [Pirellulales bacterium]|nr:glycosyltransferase family 39 protein [Pirellulales bacterium]